MNKAFFRYKSMAIKDRRRALLIASGLFALAGVFKLVGDLSSESEVPGIYLAVALLGVALLLFAKA